MMIQSLATLPEILLSSLDKENDGAWSEADLGRVYWVASHPPSLSQLVILYLALVNTRCKLGMGFWSEKVFLKERVQYTHSSPSLQLTCMAILNTYVVLSIYSEFLTQLHKNVNSSSTRAFLTTHHHALSNLKSLMQVSEGT